MNGNQWARLLAYVTGLVNQELLLQNGRSSGSTRCALRRLDLTGGVMYYRREAA